MGSMKEFLIMRKERKVRVSVSFQLRVLIVNACCVACGQVRRSLLLREEGMDISLGEITLLRPPAWNVNGQCFT